MTDQAAAAETALDNATQEIMQNLGADAQTWVLIAIAHDLHRIANTLEPDRPEATYTFTNLPSEEQILAGIKAYHSHNEQADR